MWMMGYNEAAAAADFNMNLESYTNNNGGRKLRPLVPRPPPLSHHLGEQNKREFNSQQMVVVSSRWNPTPEQLQTLEELYRRGTRTPSADEIQHITAQLRRYGKIEGKNVFYWFQNHKARERQKRRRQLDNTTNDHHQPPFLSNDINNINLDQSIERKDSEVNRTCYEVEETRNWGIPTFSQKTTLKERTPKATIMTESITTTTIDQGWIPIEQEEGNDQLLLLQRRRKSLPERNATWHQMVQCLSSTPLANPVIINSPTCTPATVTTFTPSSIMSSNGVSPYIDCHLHHDVQSCQTLQLFPVNNSREQPEKCFLSTNDVSLGPRQFIEFLPLKN